MYAIVKTGGKQYKVAAGDKINIEKLDAEVGDEVALDALMVADGETVLAGADAAKYAVTAKVVEQFKGEKIFVVKLHKRKNYKRRNGHRQLQTRVEVLSIAEAE
ncbi:MAG: 50S ribosomal protein L21 [Eggerthellaceae bacterium]|nr:50S ribosomal protein L21 [Eggerthellaceae bacterium]